jgi:pentatricopeptide repeat protein
MLRSAFSLSSRRVHRLSIQNCFGAPSAATSKNSWHQGAIATLLRSRADEGWTNQYGERSFASVQTREAPTRDQRNRQQLKKTPKDHGDNEARYKLPPDFHYRPEEALARLNNAFQIAVDESRPSDATKCYEALDGYKAHLAYFAKRPDFDPENQKEVQALRDLLSPHSAQMAVTCLLNSNIATNSKIRNEVREMERCFGSIVVPSEVMDTKHPRRGIEMTDWLSYLLLKANSRGGNVGRTLALLDLRANMKYTPRRKDSDQGDHDDDEYIHAVNAIHAAGHEMPRHRSHHHDEEKNLQTLEDPTRWLDYILDHMHSRKVALTIDLSNRMIGCFSATGRSGRAMHHFYKLVQEQKKTEANKEVSRTVVMRQNKPPPKNKVPSQSVDGGYGDISKDLGPEALASTYTQLSKELELKWSPGVTASFAFAKSLSRGACGHPPLQLNLRSWNNLIKVCCYRGALHRALYLVQHVLPKEEHLTPDVYSYNILIHALAKVGDTATQMQLLMEMTNQAIVPNNFTVQGLVQGHTNAGGVDTAISLIQDMFNQHSVLPFYETHLDVMEVALARGMTHEAKRHFFFIQQLWKWAPPHALSEERVKEVTDMIGFYRNSPRMGKGAMIRFFKYHGVELTDTDFV